MDYLLKQAKRDIRAFFVHYTDERLCWLLEHARSRRLRFISCCCFVGIPTADHALQSHIGGGVGTADHLLTARLLPGASKAELGFNILGMSDDATDEETTCRRIIPMVLAEMRKRERLRQAGQLQTDAEAVAV